MASLRSHFRLPGLLLAACLTSGSLPAQQPPVADGPAVADDANSEEMPEETPQIERLGADKFRLAGIEFDQKTREIEIPCEINLTDGLLEFALVHENGKVHESLLRTKISALQLNVIMKLLRYEASPELYSEATPTGALTGVYPEVPDKVKQGSRVDLTVKWLEEGKEVVMPFNRMVEHAVTGKPMPAGPWVYGGSVVINGKYSAQMSGDLIAIYLSHSAMFNYPGEDNKDDTVWLSKPKRVPEEGTKVTLVIAPYKSELPTETNGNTGSK